MDSAIGELLKHEMIQISPPTAPSGQLFAIGSSTKTSLIFDLRFFNNSQPYLAPPATLATIDHVRQHLQQRPKIVNGPRWFTRIDLSRCYDSFLLPQNGGPEFYFCYREKTYKYCRVPFGWADAPYIIQKIMTRFVREAAISTSSRTAAFVYLDDILVASENKEDAEKYTESILKLLRARGLRANMTKTITTASSTVNFLGYMVSAQQYNETWIKTIPIPLQRPGQRPVSAREAMGIAGALLWRCPLTLPFVAPLYYHIRGPLSTTNQFLLTSAASLATRARIYVPGQWVATRVRTALSTTTYFTDANASHGLAACIDRDGRSRIWRIPNFILRYRRHTAQQVAELYAIYRTLKIALTQNFHPITIVSDSTSALTSVLRLSPKGNKERARLLRHLAQLRVDRPRHHITFAYIPTEMNPADPLTHHPTDEDEARQRVLRTEWCFPIPGLITRRRTCPSVIQCSRT